MVIPSTVAMIYIGSQTPIMAVARDIFHAVMGLAVAKETAHPGSQVEGLIITYSAAKALVLQICHIAISGIVSFITFKEFKPQIIFCIQTYR